MGDQTEEPKSSALHNSHVKFCHSCGQCFVMSAGQAAAWGRTINMMFFVIIFSAACHRPFNAQYAQSSCHPNRMSLVISKASTSQLMGTNALQRRSPSSHPNLSLRHRSSARYARSSWHPNRGSLLISKASTSQLVQVDCAVTVRSLCGHCAVTVRSLCSHCAVTVQSVNSGCTLNAH